MGQMKNRDLYREELIRLRRYFHQHPELGLMEEHTSAYIRNYLERLGYEIQPVAPTGLIAELPILKEKKTTVVLRAEMDALPICEQTGLPYASVNKGCMHACGHDAILAVALVLAGVIADEGDSFPVRVRFLFEPAEEIGEGAKRMLDAGALEDPLPDAFLMFHFATDGPLGMAVHEGQASAMIGGIRIEVHGRSSHWSEAEKGIDSIYGAALAVQAVYDLNKNYRGCAPCLVGIGTIRGGEYPNIIADHVVLNGNIRACREEDFMELYRLLGEKFADIEKQTGTRISLSFVKEPVLAFANDDELTKTAAEAGTRVFGERFILEGEDKLFLAGDNAYRYFRKTRGLFSVFLAGVPGKEFPLHHPKFVLDEEILPYSLDALYQIIRSIKKRK